MPKQKDLKRIVRSRMEKTGESYSAARAQILRKKKDPTPDYATLAGASDEIVEKRTGRKWAAWVDVLDAFGARELPHRDVAMHVSSLGVPDWWSQTVTVGYERIRGLRAIGQRRSGSWETTKSRTFAVPVESLWNACFAPRMRNRWLPGVKVALRTAAAPKSMRIGWPDGTLVQLYFTGKGEKSSVSVQHTKLASKAEADRMKAYWSERLDALGDLVAKRAKS